MSDDRSFDSENKLQEVKDLDTEQLGGVKVESLKGFPPQSLGTKSQEASLDPVKEVRGDSGQEVRGDSVQQGIGGLVQQDIGDIQQSGTPVVEGKQSDNYNRVVSGAGTMLGAFSICMIMYKFSPIGAWLNRQLGRNKNKWKNGNEQVTEEILKYYPDPSRMSTQSDKYSMSYNSLKND
ncbi:Plasmodium vivax Vir protein, putative [Plasmodium vivax]|uniref:Vir protein, putative n=1 Tax=Plasmodium vivax TaxID=5855 RepID=A0A1G4GSB4_PLAVI|nr:Plasmodium vivax Vir protein, putative [Plasmodium vivax]